ncbi:ATP-binding protein [Streptomyces sp. A1-5]|uniref:ATP-binding protein n=1 Tax=Streptomyces sp. A1-5 TaxID=2738410 RepID=UPI001F1EBC76|nr:ATP-binding protein [Streptomyces sp. A1-5]
MNASDDAAGTAAHYAPHPYVGGRTAALRALAAWRMRWPGAPRVVVLTGSPGSGSSRLVAGFLMLCDPDYRKQLPLDDLDPATVPPDLPAPAVPSPRGLTAAQVLWLLADHLGLAAGRTADVFSELAAHEEPLTVVVPDVNLAGPVRAANEPARLVREVLVPLAATPTVHLLADVPRELAAELAGALPRGQVQVIDLDAPEWADPEGLVLHAETALTPEAGAPDLPFTTDPDARRALAEALARRADGSRLTVHLAVRSLFAHPEGFDPADEAQLPRTVGDVLDLHARRLGADPRTLRQMLAPLAFAEGDGLPVQLWHPLANAVAGRDMGRVIADGMLLAAPFVEPVTLPADGGDEGADGGEGAADGVATDRPEASGDEHASGAPETSGGAPRTLIRLTHPGLAAELRAGTADPRDAQTKIAMALLEAVPQQDWSQADPYVRDYLAAHTLEAGLLPQLLTDPGLFTHADPTRLRTAVEAVPLDQLGAPARTYLRTAPLLTRSEAPLDMRAALLETAFVEDGLLPYAEALHGLGLDLPWRTLWSLPLPGVASVTAGFLPAQEGADPAAPGGARRPVAALLVPAGTPGSRPLPAADAPEPAATTTTAADTAADTAAAEPAAPPADAAPAPTTTALLLHDLLRPVPVDADPAQVLRPSEQEQAAAPYGFSRGADYLRVWARASGEVVTALISDSPFRDADLTPDGILLVATERGVTARQILAPAPAAAPAPTPDAEPTEATDATHATGATEATGNTEGTGDTGSAGATGAVDAAAPAAIPGQAAAPTTVPSTDAAAHGRTRGPEGDHS